MKERAVTRRTVLKIVGVGATAALLSQLDTESQRPVLPVGLLALSPREGALVEAIGARIWPGDASDPGAREAGTVHYVDQALAGPLAGTLLFYQHALGQLDASSRATHGKGFVELDEGTQDAVLTSLSEGELSEVKDGQAFFGLIRTHTLEGLFSDPVHGGNRDFVGWKAVGYPGPFYLISAEAMFRTGSQLVFQMQLARRRDAVPIVRDYVTDLQRHYLEVETQRMHLPADAPGRLGEA